MIDLLCDILHEEKYASIDLTFFLKICLSVVKTDKDNKKMMLIIVQGQLCTICKNQAPHVNFCHPVVLKSYGSKVSKKIGWHFFKPGSRSFQGHIISNV